MFYPELEGNALKAYEGMCAKLKSKAMSELGLGPDQVILRPLMATDIGYGEEGDWSQMSTGTTAGAAGWTGSNQVVTVPNGRWIGIHGISTADTAGKLTQLRIQREGSDARYWDVSHIHAFQTQTGYADDPVTVDQNTSMTILNYARTASSLNLTNLLGCVAEKRGMTINP